MNTAQYCNSLEAVSKEELIGAVHQLALQLAAHTTGSNPDILDDRPALNTANGILAKAGHVGYRQ